MGSEGCRFVTDVVVADVDEAALLAAEPVLN